MTLTAKDVRAGACVYAGGMDRMVRFYRDTLCFHTGWDSGDFAEFATASGALSLFMYGRKQFVKATGEDYSPPRGINQTFEIALWLPRFADVMGNMSACQSCCAVSHRSAHQTDYGIRNFYDAAPEGNLLEIGSTSET